MQTQYSTLYVLRVSDQTVLLCLSLEGFIQVVVDIHMLVQARVGCLIDVLVEYFGQHRLL